jgi:hypothetical protein
LVSNFRGFPFWLSAMLSDGISNLRLRQWNAMAVVKAKGPWSKFEPHWLLPPLVEPTKTPESIHLLASRLLKLETSGSRAGPFLVPGSPTQPILRPRTGTRWTAPYSARSACLYSIQTLYR